MSCEAVQAHHRRKYERAISSRDFSSPGAPVPVGRDQVRLCCRHWSRWRKFFSSIFSCFLTTAGIELLVFCVRQKTDARAAFPTKLPREYLSHTSVPFLSCYHARLLALPLCLRSGTPLRWASKSIRLATPWAFHVLSTQSNLVQLQNTKYIKDLK